MPRKNLPVFPRLLWFSLLLGMTLACSTFADPRRPGPSPTTTPTMRDEPAASTQAAGPAGPGFFIHIPFVSQPGLPAEITPAAEPSPLPAQPTATETAAPATQEPERPFRARYVILFIGDGMGFEQVKAAGMYLNGAPGGLSFESFPYQAEMTTHAADGALTDSAAAATAMAAGYKVSPGVIGLALPGNGRELYTLIEYARDHDLATGLVTTTPITHATPAGFGAHAVSRTLSDEIAADYLTQTRPNLLLGGGGEGMSPAAASQAGYTVVTDRESLLALDTEAVTYLSGQFGDGSFPFEIDGLGSRPHLWEMTGAALRILDNDPDGFFVVIEGGLIDYAGHHNNLAALAGEMAGFDQAVREALDWAASRPDALILVTADHETGGLSVLQNNGQGNLPGVSWSAGGHTPVNVPVYLTGPRLESFPIQLDNTDIPALLSGGLFGPP